MNSIRLRLAAYAIAALVCQGAALSAAPVARWGVKRTRTRLSGEISSAIDPPDACRLAGRCPLARPACSAAKPPLLEIGDGRAVACPVVIERTPPC